MRAVFFVVGEEKEGRGERIFNHIYLAALRGAVFVVFKVERMIGDFIFPLVRLEFFLV